MSIRPNSKEKQDVANDSDDLGDLDDDDSLDHNNQIFQLKSQINSLKKENQQIVLQYEYKLKAIESKYQKVNIQNNQKKIQISNLTLKISRLQEQNEGLKSKTEMIRHQVQANNRKTADFHRSIQDPNPHPLGDPTQLIQQLLQKDKQIESLRQQLSQAQQPIPQVQISNQDNQLSSLQLAIDELKKKQIAYKRQYQGLLQTKEETIKKMSNHYEQNLRRVGEMKDRVIGELRRQLESVGVGKEELWKQMRTLGQKLQQSQRQLSKKSLQTLQTQQTLRNQLQLQFQNKTKSLLQSHKTHIKSLQQSHHQQQLKIQQQQTTIQIQKQQNIKLKSQINTLSEYNKYLQNNNRELEGKKKQLQDLLYKKEEEMVEIQDKCFMEVGELRRGIGEERVKWEGKVVKLQEQLISKKYMLQRLQYLMEQKQTQQQSTSLTQQYTLLTQIETLRSQKSALQKTIQTLQQTLTTQTQSIKDLQQHIQKNHKQEIIAVQNETQKNIKEILKEKKDIVIDGKEKEEGYQEKMRKMVMVCQLLQLDKTERDKEIKELRQKLNKSDDKQIELKAQVGKKDRKIKQIQEDYRTLQVLYQELNQKYKVGVQDMQKQIEQMGTKINQQRKRAQKRKSSQSQQQSTLQHQLQQTKQQLSTTQQNLQSLQASSQKSQKALQQRISTLIQQLSQSQKYATQLQKHHTKQLQQQQQENEKEKANLLEYIQQLESNVQMLNCKINVLGTRENYWKEDGDKMGKQLRLVRADYTNALSEIKQLLAKCKQLEEVSKESISHMEILRQKCQVNGDKCQGLSREKKRLQDQLSYAHDQITKLNMVLMSKQQQIKKYRASKAQLATPTFPKTPLTQSPPPQIYSPLTHTPQQTAYYLSSKPIYGVDERGWQEQKKERISNYLSINGNKVKYSNLSSYSCTKLI